MGQFARYLTKVARYRTICQTGSVDLRFDLLGRWLGVPLVSEVPEGDERDDRQQDSDTDVIRVLLDALVLASGGVTEQDESGRPQRAAERVPGEETFVGKVAHSGKPRYERSQGSGESTDEDGFAAHLADRFLGTLDVLGLDQPRRQLGEEAFAVLLADPVADRITDDRAGNSCDEDGGQGKLALIREDPAQDHADLTWQDHADEDRRFDGGEQEDESQRQVGRQLEDAFQDVAHGRSLLMPNGYRWVMSEPQQDPQILPYRDVAGSLRIVVAADAGESFTAAGPVERVIAALGNNTVARILGVSRSQPSRWRKGSEQLSPENRKRVSDLDHVLDRLLLELYPDQAGEWLTSPNAHLGGARPIDVLELRGAAQVLPAIDALAQGAFE